MGNPLKLIRAWDRELKLFPLNEEFLVSAGHYLALITSLPFVHTARRYYRLNGLVSSIDDRLLILACARSFFGLVCAFQLVRSAANLTI